jgi:hypothetical protein
LVAAVPSGPNWMRRDSNVRRQSCEHRPTDTHIQCATPEHACTATRAEIDGHTHRGDTCREEGTHTHRGENIWMKRYALKDMERNARTQTKMYICRDTDEQRRSKAPHTQIGRKLHTNAHSHEVSRILTHSNGKAHRHAEMDTYTHTQTCDAYRQADKSRERGRYR